METSFPEVGKRVFTWYKVIIEISPEVEMSSLEVENGIMPGRR